MIGVLQSKRTNCVQACIASLFDLSLEDVPEFDPEAWQADLDAWLARLGMAAVTVRMDNASVARGYSLGERAASADFPVHWRHCVVCLDGRVAWCPKNGAVEDGEFSEVHTFIYLLNPQVAGGAQC